MIKIVDNGLSLRLLYDDLDVFNHTEVAPFVKSLKGDVIYGVKKRKTTAKFDIDGEFTMSDYNVLSASVKSANLSFEGYDGAALEINVVEEHDCLKLHFTPTKFRSVAFGFLSNPFEKLYVCGEDKKGQKGNNTQCATVANSLAVKGFFSNLFNKDNPLAAACSFDKQFGFVTDKGLRYVFDTAGYADYDFTRKSVSKLHFENCPTTLTVIKDNSLKG